VGIHLYLITHQTSYLTAAKKMYDWVNSCLLAPNGLYWDHIDLAGNINTTEWSYNQGVMLGASVLLYRATGDAAYLRRAEQIAQTALNYYGAAGRFATQDAVFNAIFFKNLLQLDAVHPDGSYLTAMRRYADSLWQAVDPTTGLLELKASQPVPLLDQAALVQIEALLAWNPTQYAYLA
jgi:predicted alpha-1,6-mannanase (GH76 family)